jgi:hypothetical protein
MLAIHHVTGWFTASLRHLFVTDIDVPTAHVILTHAAAHMTSLQYLEIPELKIVCLGPPAKRVAVTFDYDNTVGNTDFVSPIYCKCKRRCKDCVCVQSNMTCGSLCHVRRFLLYTHTHTHTHMRINSLKHKSEMYGDEQKDGRGLYIRFDF